MSVFQIVLVLVGGLLVLSNFVDVKKFFPKKKEVLDIPERDVILKNTPSVEVFEAPHTVTSVVAEWENLRGTCVRFKLVNSVAKLDDTFPTFLDLVRKEANE